jgi:hypothetical protein
MGQADSAPSHLAAQPLATQSLCPLTLGYFLAKSQTKNTLKSLIFLDHMKPKQCHPIALCIFDALWASQSVGNEGSMGLRSIETSGLAIGRLKSLPESGFVDLVSLALRSYGPGGFALCPSSLRAKGYGPSGFAARCFIPRPWAVDYGPGGLWLCSMQVTGQAALLLRSLPSATSQTMGQAASPYAALLPCSLQTMGRAAEVFYSPPLGCGLCSMWLCPWPLCRLRAMRLCPMRLRSLSPCYLVTLCPLSPCCLAALLPCCLADYGPCSFALCHLVALLLGVLGFGR